MARNTNNRRLERLEKLLEVSTKDDLIHGPIDPTALAILGELESIIGTPDDLGPPRGPEFLELGAARALEKRGCTTAEIAEALPQWMAYFGEGEGVHS